MQLARGDGSGLYGSRDGRRRRRASENVVPLINVIFLLLVFFMLAGTLQAPPPLAVALPESPRAADAGDETRTAEERGLRTAALSATGELAVDGRVLAPGDSASVPTADLAAELAGANALELRADAAVPARILLPLLEALQQAGVSRVDLVTRRAL